MTRQMIRSACLAALLWAPLASACINTPATDNQGRSFSPMEYTGDDAGEMDDHDAEAYALAGLPYSRTRSSPKRAASPASTI